MLQEATLHSAPDTWRPEVLARLLPEQPCRRALDLGRVMGLRGAVLLGRAPDQQPTAVDRHHAVLSHNVMPRIWRDSKTSKMPLQSDWPKRAKPGSKAHDDTVIRRILIESRTHIFNKQDVRFRAAHCAGWCRQWNGGRHRGASSNSRPRKCARPRRACLGKLLVAGRGRSGVR